MTVEEAISSISCLSPADQIRVIREIWTNLPRDAGTFLNDSELSVLDQRWREYEENPSIAISEQEFRAGIANARSKK